MQSQFEPDFLAALAMLTFTAAVSTLNISPFCHLLPVLAAVLGVFSPLSLSLLVQKEFRCHQLPSSVWETVGRFVDYCEWSSAQWSDLVRPPITSVTSPPGEAAGAGGGVQAPHLPALPASTAAPGSSSRGRRGSPWGLGLPGPQENKGWHVVEGHREAEWMT